MEIRRCEDILRKCLISCFFSLSTLTKALTGSPGSAGSAASKLTSSAVSAIQKSTRAAGEKTAIIDGTANNSTTMEMSEKEAAQIRTLFSSYAGGKETVEKNVTKTVAELHENEQSLNGSLALWNGLPMEQRQLLEAALRNGELDMEQAEKCGIFAHIKSVSFQIHCCRKVGCYFSHKFDKFGPIYWKFVQSKTACKCGKSIDGMDPAESAKTRSKVGWLKGVQGDERWHK